jgi:hypothetical protein
VGEEEGEKGGSVVPKPSLIADDAAGDGARDKKRRDVGDSDEKSKTGGCDDGTADGSDVDVDV